MEQQIVRVTAIKLQICSFLSTLCLSAPLRENNSPPTAVFRVNETKNTSRPELFAVTHDGVTLGTVAVGKTCYLNGTEFRENGKMMVDAVWLEDASGKTVAEAKIIKCDATRMDLRFDGEIAAGPYQIVLRRMNADGKSYALARLKAEVVA